jgi:hypothetical protein
MAGCSAYTPETCPCNVHSARRADARRSAIIDAAAQAVAPLEDLAKPEPPAEWTHVASRTRDDGHTKEATDRLRVPGGWLYRQEVQFRTYLTVALTFVPDPS